MSKNRDDEKRKVSPHRDAGMNEPEPSVSDGRRTGRREPGKSEAFSEDEDRTDGDDQAS